MNGSGFTDAEIQIIIRQLFEEDLPPREEERLLEQLERVEDDVLPVLRSMLHSRDPQTVDTAASVLAHWTADDQTAQREIIKPLQRMIEDPEMADRTKVAVASVLAEQGAPIDPETFRAQLKDPHEMMRATLRAALDQADSDMARAAFLESLQEEPLDTQIRLVHDLASLDDPRTARLLAPLLHASKVVIIETVLDAVGGMLEAPAELYVALQNVAVEPPEPAIRERASKLLKRITPADRLIPKASLYGAWITSVDGDGGQMIVAARELRPDYLSMLNVYFNELEGIQDYTLLEGLSSAELGDLLADLTAEGVLVVEADLETCCELLAIARSATLQAGQPLPLSYGVWRDFLAGEDPRDLESPSLELIDVDAHPEWVTQSGQLLEHPAFAYWFFDPDDVPDRFIAAYSSARTEDNRRSIMTQALEASIDKQLQSALRQQLQRQADVLARLGDDEAVGRTLAAAAALAPDLETAPEEHPLLRAMMHRTLSGYRLQVED